MPKISVLMPVYRTPADYLRGAAESVLAQTYKDFEFIILNDSPDDSELAEVIDRLGDSRVRYYENGKKLGIPGSYNKLLSLARGEYAAVMNHDDMAHPERLRLQAEYLDAHSDVGVLGTGFKKFGEINRFRRIVNKPDDASIRSLFLFKSPLHHPTVMYRTALLAEHGITYNEKYVSLNDRQLFYDISKVSKLANLPQILYKYRFHPQMASRIFKPEVFAEKCDFHTMWFAEHGIELSAREKYIFDNYVTNGSCRITDAEILRESVALLNKLNNLNLERHFLPEKEFEAACSHYLIKRCLNAAFYGFLPSAGFLAGNNTIPYKSRLLDACNFLLGWRRLPQL